MAEISVNKWMERRLMGPKIAGCLLTGVEVVYAYRGRGREVSQSVSGKMTKLRLWDRIFTHRQR